ncbi:MAG: HNH endonuclease [Candidatus Magnetobacterium sp. LHC-1]
MPTVKCRSCGKSFNVIPSRLKQNKGKYCSRRCAVSTLFKKGEIAWNKGICHLSDEAKIRIGNINRGRKWSDEQRKKIYYTKKYNPYIPTKLHREKIGNILRSPNGIKKSSDGYIYIYIPEGHPNARSGNYVLEHILVMEKNIGRFIDTKNGECIHHLDGDKTNNKIDNLILCKNSSTHILIHRAMELFVYKLIKNGKVKYDTKKNEFRENY